MEKFAGVFGSPDKGKNIESICKNKEIADLYIPMKQLVKELKTSINLGTYALLIGDDASGRIPTLIFNDLLKKIYREKNYPDPKTIFIAGSGSGLHTLETPERNEKKNQVKELISKTVSEIPELTNKRFLERKEALVITDAVESGNSLSPVTDALKNKGISFDVAAVTAIINFPGQLQEKKESLNEFIDSMGSGKFHYGQTEPISITGKPRLSGMTKQKENLFSERAEESDSEEIRVAREDIKRVAEALYEDYKASE